MHADGSLTRRLAALCLVLGAASSAPAAPSTLDLGAGSLWRTTSDLGQGGLWGIGIFNASDGVAAWAPYGNSATTVLDPNRMMWNCGSDGSACRDASGQITGATGPTEAYFGLGFTLDSLSNVSAILSIMADDFFDLVVNGQEVVAAVLDEHQTGGQPDPMTVDITSYLRVGSNVLAIRAMDGYRKGAAACDSGFVEVSSNLGAFCQGDRINEYLYVSGALQSVPEPTAAALVSLALVGLALSRRRQATPRG